MIAPPAIDHVLLRSPVVPVATIGKVEDVQAIGEALLEGGVSIIEITLRTPQGLAAIERLRRKVPDLLVGAGTVWTPGDWVQAESAGAQFMVSPGAPAGLVSSGTRQSTPYLPGAQTPTEVHALVEAGYRAVKFFPAAPAGGVKALEALQAVFPGVRFCPTGGIGPENAADYLALDCVPCVGGSWLLPKAALAARDWRAITERAREATRAR